MNKSNELLSDHPLFRALVLMGSGLALSCGGRAEGSGAAASNGAAGESSVAGAPSSAGGASSGGSPDTSPIIIVEPSGAGAASGGAPAVAPVPDCPYAQWDCSAEPVCYLGLISLTDPVASKCFCDPKRPVTADDCSKDDILVCLEAYGQDGTPPGSLDYPVHVQCSCVKSPAPSDGCIAACDGAFPEAAMVSGVNRFICTLPVTSTCDASGTCTATSADVLRQDGIMCGCADISLR